MTFLDFLPEMPKLSDANCKNIANPNIFFPENKIQEAKSLPIVRLICGGCSNRKECLDYANEHDIFHGIWGGFTPDERGAGRTKRDWSGPNRAKRIRKLIARGVAPEIVAQQVGVSLDYVKAVIKRARNKGEIQSNQSNSGSERSS